MSKQGRTSMWKKMDRNSRLAGFILICSMLIVLVVLGFRYANIAVTKEVKGHHLDKATQQIYQSQSVDEAKRGQIFDVNGNPLAENTTSYTVVAILDKKQIAPNGKKLYVQAKDDKKVSQALAKTLGGKVDTYESVLKEGRKTKRAQVQFGSKGTQLDVMDYKKLKSQNIPGLTFVGSAARFYPNGSMAANVVGLANSVENKKTGLTTLKGQSGIEAGWNKQMTGRDGIKTTAVDENEANRAKSVPAKNGYDIYTTIDAKLQTTLENRMDALVSDMQPKSAVAVVMDTKTGDIVATTQRPNYNAETGRGVGDYWRDELTTAFEPGSVMKGITLAAALDQNKWQANNTYQSGTLKIDGNKVTDWNNGQGWGDITYSQGIALSSNVAMAKTEQKLGAKTWQKYIHRFGFLKSTNSGLPEESAGMMQFKYPFEQANTAFGQAISTTPLQMMQGYSAIAGNGEAIKPHLVDRIVNPNNNKTVYEAKRQQVSRAIKPETAKKARKQLEAVIYSKDGLGKDYALDNIRTTGKSGTAQVSTGGSYNNAQDAKEEIHSWMGMAPAKNPRYMMYIVVKQPQQDTENVTKQMAGVFKPVMMQALQMVKGDKKSVSSHEQVTRVPKVVKQDRDTAKQQVKKAHLQPLVMGSGAHIVSQSPAGNKEMLQNQRVFLNTGEQLEVPNMHGWSRNDVLTWAQLAHVKVDLQGQGFVAEQSAAGGMPVSSAMQTITIKFKQPKVE
ncbi:penicillin-binding protein 2B [Weissella uvarum]|uniref:penicillin-binding protein n=1 Tax=Weissella uvarum TaxID=1479233 RepID=UPI0019610AA7|nr:penicillin-binding protein [Weissella uvarum]MBM7617794.1 penicillin-binding protein 2B [Weissella uvarum]MCM0595827.1 penicillin-binding protein [Weissella uvarum]